MTDSRLMNVAETAKYMGRTKTAVRHMAARGRLPVTRIDGRLHFDRAEIDQLIAAKTLRKKVRDAI
jgi:excisionase family DNA binding protein